MRLSDTPQGGYSVQCPLEGRKCHGAINNHVISKQQQGAYLPFTGVRSKALKVTFILIDRASPALLPAADYITTDPACKLSYRISFLLPVYCF